MHFNTTIATWVDVSYDGLLLWWNNVFSLGTLYSNEYGDWYIFISTNKFIMKRTMRLFIDKKSFISNNGLLKSKIWIGHFTRCHKIKKLYWFTFQIYHWDSIYNVILDDKLIQGMFFSKNPNRLIVRDFWMVKIWPHFHKSIYELQFLSFFQKFCPKIICFWKF